MHALVLVLFPVLYFFTWMFYTDHGSAFFTLLMYFCSLSGKHRVASIAGIAAILFRQTNVIWVVFCLGLNKAQVLEEQLALDKKVRGNINNMKDTEVIKIMFKTTFSSVSRTLSIVTAILKRTFWYLCVILGFVVFVFLNKGIVVGDRSHHEASYNFPQLFYFLLMSFAFSFVHLIHPKRVKSFLIFMVKNPLPVLAFTIVAWYLIRKFTYEHIYLLSDNRHYTFYLWARLFKRHEMARYALIPVYLYSLYQFCSLTLHRGLLWRICYVVCVFASLVPHSLLEFRYFIIPFYVLRLNMKPPCTKLLVVELLMYVVINAATIFMFVKRPFYWPEVNTAQRFMWWRCIISSISLDFPFLYVTKSVHLQLKQIHAVMHLFIWFFASHCLWKNRTFYFA